MSQQLLQILSGCFNHLTVQQSEQRLQQYSSSPNFLQDLFMLIPNQQSQMVVLILTTIKNYTLANYKNFNNFQKDLLMNNIFDLFYEIKNNYSALNLYKQLAYIIATAAYPWPGIEQVLLNDLNNNIEAGVYFGRQISKALMYYTAQQRQKLEHFVSISFRQYQRIIQQILSNFNDQTVLLLQQTLKIFSNSFYVDCPVYLRNLSNFQKWINYFETILSVDSASIIKSQTIIVRIYLRCLSMYCNDSLDGKKYPGFSRQFRQKFAQKIYTRALLLAVKHRTDQNLLAEVVGCLNEVVTRQSLRGLITFQHIKNLFYGNILIPLCQTTPAQINLFANDQIEFVRRNDDITCYPVRRAIMDFIQSCSSYLVFQGKSQMIRMVQYCASFLQGNSDIQKQTAIRILSKIGKIVLKNSYLKKLFQQLTKTYFMPLVRSQNKITNALICQLLSIYLPFGSLSPQTVGALMELIYGKIVNQMSLVVRYNAILAFTALLGHKSALQSARPHFQNILEIYVKILDHFDHENLISCLEHIVNHFSNQIQSYAPDLIAHLIKMFASYAKNDKEIEDDEDEPDSNTPATAALSTIKQILSCRLSPEVLFNISSQILDLFKGIFAQYSKYLDQILSLYAVFVHQAKSIQDFQLPYAGARILLQGNPAILNNSRLFPEIIQQFSKIQAADSQFQQSLLAIIKNIIQKAPDNILRSYPWPKHPQLILALIENKRISQQQFISLDTSQVDPHWAPYLAAYANLLYGMGNLCPPNQIKYIIGVSLTPWLSQGLNPELIKLIINADEEQDEDYLQQQNTAQLLQKYAQQDDDQSEDFQQNSGVNYSYLYDPPFDADKDKDFLIQTVKNLNNNDAINLANNLSMKYRKKLQTFVMNS